MKRTDLTAGTDYLVSTYREWERYGGRRYRVLETEPWEAPERWARTPIVHIIDGVEHKVWGRRGRGNRVLAQPINADGVPTEPVTLITLPSIRDTWEDGQATVEQTQREADESRKRVARARAASADRFATAAEQVATIVPEVKRAADIGGRPYYHGLNPVDEGHRVTMPLSVLEALVAAATRTTD